MMNKYVVMSLMAIAVITAQVVFADTTFDRWLQEAQKAKTEKAQKAKTEIDTLISNKNTIGLQTLVKWVYYDIQAQEAAEDAYFYEKSAEGLDRDAVAAMAVDSQASRAAGWKMMSRAQEVREDARRAKNQAEASQSAASAALNDILATNAETVRVAVQDASRATAQEAYTEGMMEAKRGDSRGIRQPLIKDLNKIMPEPTMGESFIKDSDKMREIWKTTKGAYKIARNALLNYIIDGAIMSGIAIATIDRLTIECISKALKKNVPFYPKINCSKLK